MPSDVLTVTLAIVEGWNSYFSVTSSCKDNTIPVAAEGLSGLLATQNIDGSCYETQMSSAKRVSQLWTVQDPQTVREGNLKPNPYVLPRVHLGSQSN